jgi:hypothetical protein
MKKNKLRKLSILNLCTGYLMVFLFILLIMLNKGTRVEAEHKLIASGNDKEVVEGDLFNGIYEKEGIVYVNQHQTNLAKDYSVGSDRLRGVILDDNPDLIVVDGHRDLRPVAVIDNPNHVIIDKADRVVFNDDINYEISRDNRLNRDVIVGTNVRGGISRHDRGSHVGGQIHLRDNVDDLDIGLLDRRLAELGDVDLEAYDKAIRDDRDKIGIGKEDNSVDLAGLTLARDGDDIELGDLDELNTDFDQNKKGYGLGKGGELYAYDFPSRGVGAGIGSSAIGAGAGGGAGLGAGIGEGVLNGETVPTLGGVGTGPSPLAGQAAGSPGSGGVGGLVGGAGAGGAAGLTQGYVTEKLGLGAGEGKGCAEHGGNCDGHHGHGSHNYDHLPKDGALHIMMHVDGSGSILNTRKQLEEMKDTLLKSALLPYYNNNEDLYNRRVTIVDGSGERTLRFFTDATEKGNVLALAFQDEAQPVYHLPNFNKKPEAHYLDDLNKLKSNLNNHGGLYRGVMFQVDRGKTFAKSFKEFVECAFQGKGYLKGDNLKKYYWEENRNHIKNKDGIVFSDEYHAKDSGNPQYYLDLIFKASKRVGLDLNIYGAGNTDGKYIK